jgi:hypothetical protein
MTLEEDRSELDALYAEMGFTTVERVEMLDELDEIAALPVDDPAKALRFLGVHVKLLPALEAQMRGWGHEKFADQIARHAVALELWLDLPPGLALRVGPPEP